MQNDKLQKLMNDTYSACIKYKKLLKELEREYEQRFGNNPSSIDDDFFIDTFHYGSGSRMTIKQMENAQLHS